MVEARQTTEWHPRAPLLLLLTPAWVCRHHALAEGSVVFVCGGVGVRLMRSVEMVCG